MNKVRLKDIALKIQRGVSPSYDDAGIDILNQSCIRGDSVDFSKAKKFNNPSEKSKVLNGDLLINSTGTGTLGRASILASSESHIDSHITKIRPDKNLVCPEFLHIKLMSDESYRYFNLMSEGATNQIELSKATVDNFPVSLPKLDRQREIASITKRELGNADSQINALTQKLHHLEEYKTALIHNAVTKGLDANGGAIVDSIDIKEVTRLKSVCNISTGSKDTQDSVDDGKYDFYVRSQNKKKINSYTHDCDAVLTAGDGDVGKVFHCVSGKFSAHQRVYVLTDFKEVLPKFIYYSMINGFYDHVKARSQDVTVASLRMPMLESFNISLFSLDNQELIVRYLDMYLRIIQNSKDAINKKIALLLEYKKSLINEAVSGKQKE